MSTIEKYILLITQFLTGKITASQFEVSYLEVFKNEEEILPEEVFNTLNALFLDVDAYCEDVDLRDDDDLSQEELIASAKRTLEKLT